MMEMMKVPQWIKGARGSDDDMPEDVIVPPPVAIMPRPRTDDERLLRPWRG